MYLRRLFSDKKTKLVYSNGPSQVHCFCPFSDGSNRTAYKTSLKLSIETQKTQANQGRYRSKYCRILQTQINPKYNKNTTLITSLSSLYIWEQHEVPQIK